MRAKSTHGLGIGHYLLGKTIGEGTFGRVKLGTHILTDETVAVKILEKARIADVADVERVARELHILKMVQHPHVIQLYEIIETPQQLYLIMEYCSHGELFDLIVSMGRVPEPEVCRFIAQILAGVERLHELGVVHRDLKPENLLLDSKRDIKICDFGLSNTYQKGQLLQTACGSPCYAAPEMIAGKQYSPEPCDVWSCGVILFALACGYLPFEDSNTAVLYSQILNAKYEIPAFVSENFRGLVEQILTTEPERRFTIPQIREHVWFQQQLPDGLRSCQHDLEMVLDEDVLRELSALDLPREYAEKCLRLRKHNHVTTTYYLLFEKKRRQGRALRPVAKSFDEAPDCLLAFERAPTMAADCPSTSQRTAPPSQDRAPGAVAMQRTPPGEALDSQEGYPAQRTPPSKPAEAGEPSFQPGRRLISKALVPLLAVAAFSTSTAGGPGGAGASPRPRPRQTQGVQGQGGAPAEGQSSSASSWRRRSPVGATGQAAVGPNSTPPSARGPRTAARGSSPRVSPRTGRTAAAPGTAAFQAPTEARRSAQRAASPQGARPGSVSPTRSSAATPGWRRGGLAGPGPLAQKSDESDVSAATSATTATKPGSVRRAQDSARSFASRTRAESPGCAVPLRAPTSHTRHTLGVTSSDHMPSPLPSARRRVTERSVRVDAEPLVPSGGRMPSPRGIRPPSPGLDAGTGGSCRSADGPGSPRTRGSRTSRSGTPLAAPVSALANAPAARSSVRASEDASNTRSIQVMQISSKDQQETVQEVMRVLRALRVGYKQVSDSLVRCERRGLRFDLHVTPGANPVQVPSLVKIQRVSGELAAYREMSAKVFAELKL